MATSTLSPQAPAFHPLYEPVHVVIYNDGIPSLTFTSEHDVCEILHGIRDEAIDEGFPPDAHDAAELEAVDAFVEMMAQLSFMEEREEQARIRFAYIKQRWEARRQLGLSGRPRGARHVIHQVNHHMPKISAVRTLVPFSAHARREISTKAKLKQREMEFHHESKLTALKAMSAKYHPLQIQQPRKHTN